MSNAQKHQAAIVSLIDQASELLGKHGFESHARHEWHRQCGWKSDIVVLEIREQRLRPSILCSFRIVIPSTGLVGTMDWPFQYLAQENVQRIIGVEPTYQKFPNFRVFQHTFTHRLVSEIERALPWFDRYGTPEKCLAEIGNLFNMDSDAFKDAQRYFLKVINR